MATNHIRRPDNVSICQSLTRRDWKRIDGSGGRPIEGGLGANWELI